MIDYRRQLIALAGVLVVTPPNRFSWFGERSNFMSQVARKTIDIATMRPYLVASIRAHLYGRFYLPGFPVPLSEQSISQATAAVSPFVDSLVQANSGTGCWQPGWSMVMRANGGIWVERDGLTVFASNEECRRSFGSSETSQYVCIRTPKGSTTRSPGFYLAQSDAPSRPVPGEVHVRLYWHLTAGAAAPLMSLVTGRLNADRVPFQFKVLYDPQTYKRNDAGVLYIAKSDLHRAAPHLESIYGAIQPELMPGEPAFTKRLAPGLGLAEDPGNGESFGTHRCGILAEAFVLAAERAITKPAAILELIHDCFQNEGLDLDQPYLNPGSTDDYDRILSRGSWKVADIPIPTVFTIGEETVDVEPMSERQAFIEAASTIGDRLVASASWHDERCTWLGELAPAQPGRLADFGALGPDVYTGTAGIALFLAQLYGETGVKRYAETARAAVRQSIHRLARQAGPMPIGYYTGWTGIAAVAAQVGHLTHDEDLAINGARELFDHPPEGPPWTEPDVMAGTAGAILACLSLAQANGDERYLKDAIQCGDSLLAAAKRRGSGICWPTSTLAGRRPLAGFAHGAAGIATALLQLFMETGDDRFVEAANAGFTFERRNFCPVRENWIDLRSPIVGSRFGPAAITESHWCHGAAGIAISRLLAWQILGDEVHRAEADTAIRTTCRWFETEPVNVPGNWTLCHGFPGNADILLFGSKILPSEAPRLRQLAYRAGSAALKSQSLPTEPGLMLGQAGLGLFYLRLANPTIPSPLVPGAISAVATTV